MVVVNYQVNYLLNCSLSKFGNVTSSSEGIFLSIAYFFSVVATFDLLVLSDGKYIERRPATRCTHTSLMPNLSINESKSENVRPGRA